MPGPRRTNQLRRPRRGIQATPRERVMIIPTPPMPQGQVVFDTTVPNDALRAYDPGWDTAIEPTPAPQVVAGTLQANNIYVNYDTTTTAATPQYFTGGLGLFRDPPPPKHRFKVGQTILLACDDYEDVIPRGTKLLIRNVYDENNYSTLVLNGKYKDKELYVNDRQVKAAMKPRNLPAWF